MKYISTNADGSHSFYDDTISVVPNDALQITDEDFETYSNLEDTKSITLLVTKECGNISAKLAWEDTIISNCIK